MGGTSATRQASLDVLKRELDDLRKRGAALTKKQEEQKPTGTPAETTPAVFDSKMKDSAVSSLQRIGGGGGAFGGDPLIELNRAQLKEQKEQTAVLKQIVQKKSGYVEALMPDGSYARFTS
jgi:hypothetical protein